MMLRALALVLAHASTVAHAGDVERNMLNEHARSLVGIEIGGEHDNDPLPGNTNCRMKAGLAVGGGRTEDWSGSLVQCGDGLVMTLDRFVGKNSNGQLRWRITDALALPPVLVTLDPIRPEGPYLYQSGSEACKLDGRYGAPVVAVVRQQGKQKLMTWRNGLQQAWTFDPRHSKIVPVAPKRVVCERAEPVD